MLSKDNITLLPRISDHLFRSTSIRFNTRIERQESILKIGILSNNSSIQPMYALKNEVMSRNSTSCVLLSRNILFDRDMIYTIRAWIDHFTMWTEYMISQHFEIRLLKQYPLPLPIFNNQFLCELVVFLIRFFDFIFDSCRGDPTRLSDQQKKLMYEVVRCLSSYDQECKSLNNNVFGGKRPASPVASGSEQSNAYSRKMYQLFGDYSPDRTSTYSFKDSFSKLINSLRQICNCSVEMSLRKKIVSSADYATLSNTTETSSQQRENVCINRKVLAGNTITMYDGLTINLGQFNKILRNVISCYKNRGFNFLTLIICQCKSFIRNKFDFKDKRLNDMRFNIFKQSLNKSQLNFMSKHSNYFHFLLLAYSFNDECKISYLIFNKDTDITEYVGGKSMFDCEFWMSTSNVLACNLMSVQDFLFSLEVRILIEFKKKKNKQTTASPSNNDSPTTNVINSNGNYIRIIKSNFAEEHLTVNKVLNEDIQLMYFFVYLYFFYSPLKKSEKQYTYSWHDDYSNNQMLSLFYPLSKSFVPTEGYYKDLININNLIKKLFFNCYKEIFYVDKEKIFGVFEPQLPTIILKKNRTNMYKKFTKHIRYVRLERSDMTFIDIFSMTYSNNIQSETFSNYSNNVIPICYLDDLDNNICQRIYERSDCQKSETVASSFSSFMNHDYLDNADDTFISNNEITQSSTTAVIQPMDSMDFTQEDFDLLLTNDFSFTREELNKMKNDY